MKTQKVKHHRNSDTKTVKRESTAVERSLMNYWGGLKHVLRRQPRPRLLKWCKTFCWLFGSHDNPLTGQ